MNRRDDALSVGAWHVDLVTHVVIEMGRCATLDHALALAAREDGGPLRWEEPWYYSGQLSMGRRGVWLVDYREAVPMRMGGRSGASTLRAV